MTDTREKHFYSGQFAEQLVRAMNGHAPWKAAYNREYKPIPPTEKQKAYLRRLGAKKIPASKFEASGLIDQLLKERNG